VALLFSLWLLQGLVPGQAQLQARPLAPTRVGTPAQPLPASSEALASRSIWSRPESYPLRLRPRADLYRPSAEWIGRLILPAPEDTTAAGAPAGDWVWIEIEQAPQQHQALIGRRLRLHWADDPQLQHPRLLDLYSPALDAWLRMIALNAKGLPELSLLAGCALSD
jgi:hypothetical protein